MMDQKKKINCKILCLGLVVFVGIIILSFFASAVPPLPTEIYGTAKSYNLHIMSGTNVNVYDSENNLCGSYKAINTSYNFSGFGVLTCRGEDEFSAGPTEGEILTFKIGNAPASAVALSPNGSSDPNALNYTAINITWESGTFKEVMLVAPPLLCGDSFCDSLESCKTCVPDCHECPTGNATGGGNTTGNASTGGTPSTGGGTGGGAGGGAAGGGGESTSEGEAEDGSTDGEEADEGEEMETECLESWMCGDWQICLPNGVQYRDCADVNECGTSDDIPLTEQKCDYDAQIYELNETAINRTGTNPPRQESPALISVCKDKLPILSIQSIIFICLLFIIIFIAEIDYRKRLKRIESDSGLDELKKLELKYFEKRKKAIFFVVIIVLAIIVYLYHYFFYICRDKYVMYLWLLASGILMTPVIVHLLIELSIFSESEKNRRVSALNDIHYKHFEILIEIADRELIVAEKNIMDKLYALELKPEFNTWLSGDKVVNKIYSDMTKLFNLYKTLKNPMYVEKDLLESIRKLDEDEEFVNSAKKYPELMEIKSNLSLLYSAYEYKQTLYDELSTIEKEYGVSSPLVR